MNSKSVVVFILVIVLTGCKKVYFPPDDPAVAILGKWKIIKMGNWPDMYPIENPSGYKEYLPDSILKEYDNKTGKLVFVKKYWIDSLLHEGIYREDGYLLKTQYKYQFYDDKLKLEYSNIAAMFNTSISQRLN